MKNKLVISGVLCIVIISLVILYLVRETPKIKETPITDTSSIEPVGYSIKRKPGDSVVFTCVQYRDNDQNNKFIRVQVSNTVPL